MQKLIGALAFAAVLLVAPAAHAAGVNVVLNTDVNDQILAELGRYGRVRDVLTQLDAVTVQASHREPIAWFLAYRCVNDRSTCEAMAERAPAGQERRAG
jgi:hypothetical protein